MPTLNDYKSPKFPTWCPGCGDFGIWTAIKQALVATGKNPHEVCFVYGIGCSGNMASHVRAYGFHGLHGRALGVALGLKIANPRLTVIVVAGDGDTYSEGIGHFVAAMRQNLDINLIVHDNHTFSLTTGQASPTSPQGRVTSVTPQGSVDRPLNPLALALSQEASFIARGFAGDIPHLAGIFQKMIEHPGFSYTDVLQHCPTYDKERTVQWYWKNIKKLEQEGFELEEAMKLAREVSPVPLGVLYKKQYPSYHEVVKAASGEPLARKKLAVPDLTKDFEQLM